MTPEERFWRRRARAAALKFNFGWWLQEFLPFALGASLLATGGILWLRTAQFPPGLAPSLLGGILVACSLGALLSARPKFIGADEALAQLDLVMKLHNRLVSASHGIGAWPPLAHRGGTAWAWQARRILPPAAAAACLCAAAFIIPVQSEKSKAPDRPPFAWTQVEALVEALRQTDLVDKDRLREIDGEIEKLRQQPKEEWYSHQSLEAGDHLKEDLETSIRRLSADLDAARESLEAGRAAGNVSTEAAAALRDQHAQAMTRLKSNPFPLEPGLAKQIQELDPQNVRRLTEAEWTKIQQRMKDGAQTCALCTGAAQVAQGNLGNARAVASATGEADRSPGAAPLGLAQEKTSLGTRRIEGISAEDLSHAAVADVIRTTTTDQKPAKDVWNGPMESDRPDAAGGGGEAVWEQSASPDEKAALQRFFTVADDAAPMTPARLPGSQVPENDPK